MTYKIELGGCPCLYTTPCHHNCTCANGGLSGGCTRCPQYGSLKQRRAQAQWLASIIDSAVQKKTDAWNKNIENGESYKNKNAVD